MIKILFFIENLTGGGAEKVLCNLVNAMDQSKFDITVQTLWKADPANHLKPGIRYRYCYASNDRISQLRSRLEAALGLTYRLHIRDNYDIEVAYLEFGSTKILSHSTNRKAKKIAWVHCDLTKAVADPKTTAKKMAPWYLKYDQVVCVSQSVKDRFDELFQNRFPSSVLYNIIDDDAIRHNSLMPFQKSLTKRRFTVLSVGRFSPQKNYSRLLRSHKHLLDEGYLHDLWLIGDGTERVLLEQYIAENELQDSVWMPGYVENPYPFMRLADLLVCSSNYEGYSTFLTEGIILGKPIMTTDVSGAHELLGNSEYGMIVDNSDEAFLIGLRDMLTRSELRQAYADCAAKRGLDFSSRKLTVKSEQLFFDLIGEGETI